MNISFSLKFTRNCGMNSRVHLKQNDDDTALEKGKLLNQSLLVHELKNNCECLINSHHLFLL